MASNKHYILDAGHGGVDEAGKYHTSLKWWKRSYFDKDGQLLSSRMGTSWLEKNAAFKFYEGEFNRDVRDRISKLLMEAGISHSFVADGVEDLSNGTRAYHANLIAMEQDLPCVFISIHSNAGGGRGFEVFTSKGYTAADPYGQILAEELFAEFEDQPKRRDMRDGDFDKEADFTVLKRTAMPAVLSENLFYDNWNNAQLLMKDEIRQRIAEAHYKAILRMDEI